MLSTLVHFSVPLFVPRQVDSKYISLRKMRLGSISIFAIALR